MIGLRACPNPLNGGTGIRFEVGRPGPCRVEIFDLRGRRQWCSDEIPAAGGEVRVAWDGRDAAGKPLPSGTYLCRVIHTGAAVAATRLTIVR